MTYLKSLCRFASWLCVFLALAQLAAHLIAALRDLYDVLPWQVCTGLIFALVCLAPLVVRLMHQIDSYLTKEGI